MKIVSLSSLKNLDLGTSGPVAYCHGCFDNLHIGHVKHLQAAKQLASVLIVTVTADKFVNKGENRPLFTDEQRAEILAALECVDYVAINNAPDACEALVLIKPDFYVKGQDYKGTTCQEFIIAESVGAKVVFTSTEKFSTTQLIERLKA